MSMSRALISQRAIAQAQALALQNARALQGARPLHDRPYSGPVLNGFSGLGGYSMPGTYGGGMCGCQGGGLVGTAQGLESWIRMHPFLAVAGALLLGYSLKGKR